MACRPGRSANDAILKVKEYAEQGYTHAVAMDLSKYFDTLNQEMLLNILRREVKDERASGKIYVFSFRTCICRSLVSNTER